MSRNAALGAAKRRLDAGLGATEAADARLEALDVSWLKLNNREGRRPRRSVAWCLRASAASW